MDIRLVRARTFNILFFLEMMKKAVAVSSLLIFLFSAHLDAKDKDQFLLFGISIRPSPKTLSNSWVISQGRDFPIINQLFIGYETGISYKIFEDAAEYHFKTLFNFKYDLIRLKQVIFYSGAGAGLLELFKVTRFDSDFHFYVGTQAIIGCRVGLPKKDKLCFEFQFLNSTEEKRGIQINFLTGVKF